MHLINIAFFAILPQSNLIRHAALSISLKRFDTRIKAKVHLRLSEGRFTLRRLLLLQSPLLTLFSFFRIFIESEKLAQQCILAHRIAAYPLVHLVVVIRALRIVDTFKSREKFK